MPIVDVGRNLPADLTTIPPILSRKNFRTKSEMTTLTNV